MKKLETERQLFRFLHKRLHASRPTMQVPSIVVRQEELIANDLLNDGHISRLDWSLLAKPEMVDERAGDEISEAAYNFSYIGSREMPARFVSDHDLWCAQSRQDNYRNATSAHAQPTRGDGLKSQLVGG